MQLAPEISSRLRSHPDPDLNSARGTAFRALPRKSKGDAGTACSMDIGGIL
jgi:hypothetical protein